MMMPVAVIYCFYIAKQYGIVCIYNWFFASSPTETHLNCFQFKVVLNEVVICIPDIFMNECSMHICGYIPRNKIARSHSKCTLASQGTESKGFPS